jgi:ABC-type transport system involved in Fe-S cluster assembly fused permease/ATPase subunit
MRQSFVDLGLIQALLDEPIDVRDAPRARALKPGGGAIVFDNVSFAYAPERAILRGISFEIPAGRSLAIVGASGAGKSTIGRLLSRFYDAQSGAIRIDGCDISAATQASVRAAIGVVPQDTMVFNNTIFYNIAYGRQGAARADVIEAARLAQLDRFIDALPNGYDTQIGERGLKLSGGERQRLAIARMILKRPPIFLFDEATSSLDSHNERAIQRALREISAGRTRLIIAHRLSTIVDADEIIVLDDGQVAERGDHGALLRAGGRYAALWNEQLARS